MSKGYAEIIRNARARAGLSQRELARRAGTSQAVISAYENALREPGFNQLEKLAAAAGFSLRVTLDPAKRTTARSDRRPWLESDSDEDDDRILENLRLTPSQRLRKMGALRGFTARYRGVLTRQR